MKSSLNKGLLAGVPANRILMISLAIFISQAAVIMFYSNGTLVFPDRGAYGSLAKGAAIADSGFAGFHADVQAKKEVTGVIYPLLGAIVYKIAGPYNTVPVFYVLAFFVFAFVFAAYFKLAIEINGREAAFFSALIFVFSEPVILGIFSGADVMLTFALLAANLYFSYFEIEKKRYTGALATAAMMLLNGPAAAAFGACSLLYTGLRMYRKASKNYTAALGTAYALVFIFSSVLFIFAFFDRITAEAFQASGLADAKTFTVDTFFRDGFLWSKLFPPFVALFFFITFFIRASAEIRERRVTFVTYAAFLTLAALLCEFFAVFSKDQELNTNLFLSPYYMVFILYAVSGIVDTASYFGSGGRGSFFTRSGVLYGVLTLTLIYSVIFSYIKLIEKANDIRYIVNERNVSKFIKGD